MQLLRACALELFGSFLLIYVSGWTFTFTRDAMRGDVRTSVFISAACCSTVVGLFSYASIGISKITLNPIMTLCFMLTRHLKLFFGAAMIIAQFLGAFLSSWLLKEMFDRHDLRDSAVRYGDSYSNTIIQDRQRENKYASTCAVEGMAVMILTILTLFPLEQYSKDYILRILGQAMGTFLGILSVQNTTGAALGPLRVYPQSLFDDNSRFKGFWVYWVGPLIGMIIGILITSFMMGKNLFGVVPGVEQTDEEELVRDSQAIIVQPDAAK